LLAALLLEVISGIQYYYTHCMLAEELEKRAELELTTKVILTKSNLNLAVNSVNGHLWDVMRNIHQPDSMLDVAECVLRSHKNLLGCGIAFEPNFYPAKGRLYEPYAYWHDGDVVKAQIAGDHHDYTQNASYQKAVHMREWLWTEPYYYEETKTSMITYVQPLKDANDSIMAVFMLDLSTDWLGDTLNYRQLYPSSYTLLLSEQGKLIAGPRTTEKNEEDIRRIIADVNDDDTGKLLCSKENTRTYSFQSSNGDEAFVFTAKFKTDPRWQMVVVCYEDEVFGPLREVRVNILLMMLVGFAIMGFIVYRFFMKERDLNKALLKQTRIDSELRIARDIQLKMLPMTYPPFPNRSDLDIYGSLVPAREVGGDMYDFFIRDEKLFFCIGDVSGKGVPAAMLMASTHSMFRAFSSHGNDPAQIMYRINESACQGNNSNMFVTIFIGVLNLQTGQLCYCNAGHDRPIVINSNGISMLDAKPHLPVGIFDDMHYETEESVLTPNSMMFLYTDGLTEAMAPLPATDHNAETVRHNLFGIERVMSNLQHHEAQISAKQLLDSINMAVNNFVGDAEQSDDLTMLAIRYTPS
jgi:sigma-B regulation protein RsbU (phosphoserine phosphatase)